MELDALHTFVEVFRKRSFAKVARDRKVDPSTISRIVGGLEAELGVRLFQRTTRELTPTEAAECYFERVAPALAELRAAADVLGDANELATGSLRVTAPVTFAETNVIPLLPRFAAAHPGISFELLLTNDLLDLIAERIDVALRVGRLSDSNYVSVKLCDLVYAACASPTYLRVRGTPKRPEDLAEHDCLRYASRSDGSCWRFLRGGESSEVRVHGTVTANNGATLRACATLGMGVVLQPLWNLRAELESGALVRLFPDYELTVDDFGGAAWLVYPTRSYVPRKVRAFTEFLRAAFTARPSRD